MLWTGLLADEWLTLVGVITSVSLTGIICSVTGLPKHIKLFLKKYYHCIPNCVLYIIVVLYRYFLLRTPAQHRGGPSLTQSWTRGGFFNARILTWCTRRLCSAWNQMSPRKRCWQDWAWPRRPRSPSRHTDTKNHWSLAANLFCFVFFSHTRDMGVTYFCDVYHILHEGSSKLRVELTRAVLWTYQVVNSRIHNGLVEQWTCLCSWFDWGSSFLSTVALKCKTQLTFRWKRKKKQAVDKESGADGMNTRSICPVQWWCWSTARSYRLREKFMSLPSVICPCFTPQGHSTRPLFISWIRQKKKIQPRTIYDTVGGGNPSLNGRM